MVVLKTALTQVRYFLKILVFFVLFVVKNYLWENYLQFFSGHGNPMNAIQQNQYTEEWQKIGQTIERPKAIL